MKKQIEREIKALASSEQREVLMRFFKTGKGQYGEGDKFLGVKVPQVRSVVKKYAAACSFDDVEELITSPFHEIRLAAILTLCRKFQLAKDCPAEQEECVNTYLAHTDSINNWDLVDLSCYEILGNWLLDKDRDVLYEMAAPGLSLWERSARQCVAASTKGQMGQEETNETTGTGGTDGTDGMGEWRSGWRSGWKMRCCGTGAAEFGILACGAARYNCIKGLKRITRDYAEFAWNKRDFDRPMRD